MFAQLRKMTLNDDAEHGWLDATAVTGGIAVSVRLAADIDIESGDTVALDWSGYDFYGQLIAGTPGSRVHAPVNTADIAAGMKVWIDARSPAPYKAETSHVVTFTEGTVQPSYILSSGSITSPADGTTEARVPFTLMDMRTGLPASGQLLNFNASGSATIIPQNINGQVTVDMFSTVVGSQQLIATLNSVPSVTSGAPVNFTVLMA
ncbi:Ig-like domain-containing protein [Yersinia pekkanenii]|uniref:Uncharacterized protein n=1 Tax=Yersinia pekkanenii TaxID=1288385 RepID=A0A0T9QMA6_9GAMM|nr:Ig-like domain-containing protein [Yersinia pekkanenii]CNI18717.1 Uncharacterised protein [Yersinia pekkanenii]CRY64909.1 Uncharacterised protein [Yersinia pekkanenii]